MRTAVGPCLFQTINMAYPVSLEVALVSAGLLGLRHGFDYDHVAAITDIASVQSRAWDSMRLGFLYAVGHAITVAVLGMAAILFQLSLPSAIDAWMERIVGVTLVVLGVYVFATAVFPSRKAHSHTHPRTRIMLIADALLWCVWRVRQWFTRRPVERKRLFPNGIGRAPAILVGVIHGVGAETPSQVLLFLLAANLGGVGKGMLGLAMFIAGLLVMNGLMCATAAGLMRFSTPHRGQWWLAMASATYSILVGVVFIASRMPT